MGQFRQNLGLVLLSVEATLQSDTIVNSPLLISPIDSRDRLKQLCQHLKSLVPQRSAQIFSVDSPAQTPEQVSLTMLEGMDLSDLCFPVSLYLEPSVDGNIQALVDVVAQLRDPDGGCPWDLEQTPQTLTKYIIEEAYEAVEAIQSESPTAIAEELGDLLLQVVLQAQIAKEAEDFSLATVTQGITDKLIRRHPHVFGETTVKGIDQVRENWEAIKAAEKGIDPNDRHQVSRKMIKEAKSFPPIMGGLKLAQHAAEAGLEWPNLAGVWAKFYEELAEFQEALLIGTEQEQLEELGDLLFTLINVARWCKLDPSEALRLTNHKLIQRVELIEAQADKSLKDYSLDELDDLWNQAKQALKAEVVSNHQATVDGISDR